MSKSTRLGVWLGACLLALAVAGQAQQPVLEVITLGYRQADEESR